MKSYDVAIIGLGPVGCTAAIMFAESGLSVVAVERDREVYKLPRAVAMDGEIIRGFQRFSRGEAIDDMMQSVRPGERWGFTNSEREWLFGEELVDFGNNGWQPMNGFDQPELEQYLRSEALAHENVTAYIGYSATGVENTQDGVKVTVVEEGLEDSIGLEARYALGCDGASSAVRKQLDIGWQDLGYNHDWLVVDIVLKEGHTLNNETVQVCDPDRILSYVCPKDPYRRWEFKLNEGETADEMLREETILSLIDPWTPRGTYDIRRKAVYQFHAATADTWRIGNIFIAGDAAHQTPPFLGQGMNAGMRDIINLSWKFPMVLSGSSRDALLDTYHEERSAHAHDLVDWAVAVGRLIDHTAAVERCDRNGEPAPETPEELQYSGYGQGREQPPIRAGAIVLEQVSDTGSTGYLFAQPIVRTADSRELRLDELLGKGFAIVGKSQASLQLSEASQQIIDLLETELVSLDSLKAVRGEFDALFDYSSAAIVRPDRIVFGHTSDQLSLDQLVSKLASALSLNIPAPR
jgi:3-(3-hydroxy-phenyl)propionate hydroxylase